MKSLLYIFSCSFFIVSFQASANRPAEDESTAIFEQQIVDARSSLDTSETDSTDHQAVTATQPIEKITEILPVENVSTDEQSQEKSQFIIIDFPLRGMDMSKVLNELGEPEKRFPAIGTPPITRWVYPDRTVFFEYSHVIHVVAK